MLRRHLLHGIDKKHLNLAQQFALASFTVLLAGMLAVGWWVSKKIETEVIRNTAVSAALYLNSFVAPELQELAGESRLSDETIAALDRLYRETPLGEKIVSFKVWGQDGTVLYSNNQSLIGRVFPITPSNAQAWNGAVTAESSGLEYAEHVLERGLGIPVLEIYSPVRESLSNRVIAVAEFYDDASKVTGELIIARAESWLIVAGVTSGHVRNVVRDRAPR